MRSILCNNCGTVGYSSASAELLKGGCAYCGVTGRMTNLADQRIIALDEEFVYGPPQFSALISAMDQAAGMLGDIYLAGFVTLLKRRRAKAALGMDISLVGIEMIVARLGLIHNALDRIKDLDLPDEALGPNGLEMLGLFRVELERLLMPKAA